MSRDASTIKDSRIYFLGSLASRIFGFLRDILIVSLYSQVITDTWASAFRVPNFFRRVFAEGGVSASIAPNLIETLENQGNIGFYRKSNLLLNKYFCLSIILVGFLLLYKIEILKLLTHEKFEYFSNAIPLFKIMSGFVGCWLMASIYNSIFTVQGRLFWPAYISLIFNLIFIGIILLPKKLFQIEGGQLAWGILIAGAIQWLILDIVGAQFQVGFLFQLKHLSTNIKEQLNFYQVKYKKVNIIENIKNIRLENSIISPMLIFSFFPFLNLLSLKSISSLGIGYVSYFYLIERLLEFPMTLVSVSIGSALLPHLTRYHQASRGDLIRVETKAAFQLLTTLTFPAMAGLYLLSPKICEILFLRGEITIESIRILSEILRVQVFTIIFVALSRLISTYYFAIKEYSYPLFAFIFSVIFHLFTLWVVEYLKFTSDRTVSVVILFSTILFMILLSIKILFQNTAKDLYAFILESRFSHIIFGTIIMIFYILIVELFVSWLGLSNIYIELSLQAIGGLIVYLLLLNYFRLIPWTELMP